MDRNHSLNRNTSNIFNHIRSRVVRNNLVTPDILVSEIWMQDNANNGVEIIELNTSNSEVEETPRAPTNNYSQVWSFVNDRYQNVDEDYRINNIARERRRKKNDEEFSVAFSNEYLHDHDTQTNFNGFHYINDTQISENRNNHQINCFTIINNHIVNSDSSSDDYARVEEIQPHFVEDDDDKYWDHVYNEDYMTSDQINPEKRTVWIYSFKNKRRLSENDFELVNIASNNSGTSTSNSLSDEENVFRIASPIPDTFIPRLDLYLAQTLSTVTEISEIKQSSNESLAPKPINNWLTERKVPKNVTEVPDVVNWMALSPRERRRRFKNTNSNIDHNINYHNQNTREFTYAEGSTETHPPAKSRKTSSIIQVDVEVHANDIPDITIEKSTDAELVSIKRFGLAPRVENEKVTNTSINISYADAGTETDLEKGDFEFELSNNPKILLTNKTYDIFTDPIEKLNSSKWIIGDETEEQTTAFDYISGDNEIDNKSLKSDASDSASRRLWVKSIKLMKSPIWAEYLPITESPPSLHISLSLSSTEEKNSWLKRIGKYFNCCK